MTSVLLHIGTPKTGTTSFQEWAWANRHRLEAEAGTHVYEGLLGTNHFEFGLLCKRASRNGFGELAFPDHNLPEWRSEARNHIRRQVDAARAAEKDLLISSEVISLLRHPDELARLKNLLGDLRVRSVAATREPSSFLSSWRRQIGPGGWSPYRSSAGYTEADTWLVDYEALRKAFERGFGPGSIGLVSYEEALQRHGTVIPAISEALGIECAALSPVDEKHWMNPSAGKPAIVDSLSRPELRAELAQVHRRLGLLEQERDGLKTQLELGTEINAKQEAMIERLERQLSDTNRELESVRRAADLSAAIAGSITKSASWRLTAPARKVKHVARRARPRSAREGMRRLGYVAAGLGAAILLALSLLA